MQYIDFNVQHQTITRTDNYEVVGRSQNYLYARFTFCEEWEGLIQTAVFSTNNGKHYSALIEDGKCLVPWEVLRGAEFWVGVFAGDRITTSTVRVPVKPGVKISAKPGTDPSPTAYEMLVKLVAKEADRARAEADRASIPAVSGVYNVILTDSVTGERYALIVENGRLSLLGVSETLEATHMHFVDFATGTAYELTVESGRLNLKEV